MILRTRLLLLGVLAITAGASGALWWIDHRGFGISEHFRVEHRRDSDLLAPPKELTDEKIAARIHDYTMKIGDAALAMKPEERKPLFAAQRVYAQMAKPMAAYEEAFKQLSDAGFASAATLRTPESIAERLEMVRHFEIANRDLREFYKHIDKRYREEIEKEELPAATRAGVIEGFRRGANVDLNLTIRRCDDQLAKALRRVLELMTREWGQWKVAPDGDALFLNESARAEYAELLKQIRATTEQQQNAQRELLLRTQEQERKLKK